MVDKEEKKEGRYSLYMVTVDCDDIYSNNPHGSDTDYVSKDILKALMPVSKDIIGQLEKGSVEGKFHYQLAVRTNAQIRPSTLRKKIMGYVNPIGTERRNRKLGIDKWTFLPIQSTFNDAVEYCTKRDTRVGDKIVYGTLMWSMQEEADWLDDPETVYPLASVDPFATL